MPKAIQDEFTERTDLTRQQKARARRERDGRCVDCSKGRSATSALYCVKHEEAHAKRMRERGGYRRWHAGGRGRKPNRVRVKK